jgi:hypothetical protein
MGKLIVINHMTLDGVMQAPGRPDEDARGGFERGGWAAPRTDDVMPEVLGKRMAQGGPLLLGRQRRPHPDAARARARRRVPPDDPSARAGHGARAVPEGGPAGVLALADTVVTTKGVVIGTYRTAE